MECVFVVVAICSLSIVIQWPSHFFYEEIGQHSSDRSTCYETILFNITRRLCSTATVAIIGFSPESYAHAPMRTISDFRLLIVASKSVQTRRWYILWPVADWTGGKLQLHPQTMHGYRRTLRRRFMCMDWVCEEDTRIHARAHACWVRPHTMSEPLASSCQAVHNRCASVTVSFDVCAAVHRRYERFYSSICREMLTFLGGGAVPPSPRTTDCSKDRRQTAKVKRCQRSANPSVKSLYRTWAWHTTGPTVGRLTHRVLTVNASTCASDLECFNG